MTDSAIREPRPEPYQDAFIRETDRRVRFLMAAAASYPEAARFIEELRRGLGCRPAPPPADGF